MELIRVEILQHIRKVQLSAKQRPVYFEWDGYSLRGKKTKIPRKFFRDKTFYPTNLDPIRIEDLKPHFRIGVFLSTKLINTITENSMLPDAKVLDKTDLKYRLVIQDDVDNLFPIDFNLVLCNPKIVNTPRMYLIKGQDFYNSKIREFQRGVVMDEIKKCYRPYLENLPVIIDYPVRIECEVHDTIKNFYDNTNSNEGLGSPWDIDNYAYPYMKAFPDLLQELKKIKNDDRLHITQPPSPLFVPIEDHSNRKLVFIISKDEREIIANNETYKAYHGNKNTYETEDLDLVKDDPFGDEPLTFEQLNTPFDI